MNRQKTTIFLQGVRDGIPVALGYLAVSFSLGIMARGAGLSPLQGFAASLLNNASAGEYAAFTAIAANAAYAEVALITLIANARYLLMSCALSQRISPETKSYHRLLIGFDVTDELFGLAVAREGWLPPRYFYGAMSLPLLGWSSGTALGIVAGNILPGRVVTALSVALYGMFLAVVIPPSRKSKAVAGLVLAAFVASFAVSKLVPGLSSGMRTIVLTVVLCAAAAILFPVREEARDAA